MSAIYSDEHRIEVAPGGRSNAAALAFILFLLAVVPPFFVTVFWLPLAVIFLFCAFILCIVALSNGHVAGGVTMMVLICLLAPIILILGPATRTLAWASRVKAEEAQQKLSALEEQRKRRETEIDAARLAALAVEKERFARARSRLPIAEQVKFSQANAVANHPDLGRAGSSLNTAFLRRLNEWKSRNDARLSRPDWPEVLADDCAAHP